MFSTVPSFLQIEILQIKERMVALDGKEEKEEISYEETMELHGITSNIHSLSRLNTSIF